jgi:hypothetical protein
VLDLLDFMATARELDLFEASKSGGEPFCDRTIEEMADTCPHAIIDQKTQEVYGIGGIVPRDEEAAFIWLLCTDMVEKKPLKFLRFCRDTLGELLRLYPVLCNSAWKGNELHLKWLSWLGAEWIAEDKEFKTFIIREGK